jgi:Flp pilus assembly protein TadD
VPRVNLGRYLLASDDPAGAQAALEAALDRNPTSADALGALGVAQARRGDRLEADRSWHRALRFDPAQPEARAGLERLGAW